MTEAFVALGSNLASPLRQAEQALAALDRLPDTRVIRRSSFYRTPPLGPAGQPDYLNAVVQLETALSPLALLHALQQIEQQQGRVRTAERWGPRTLDLDLLLYGEVIMQTPELTLPHYAMQTRAFVLLPLAEIAPDRRLPNGQTVRDCLAQLACDGIRRWE